MQLLAPILSLHSQQVVGVRAAMPKAAPSDSVPNGSAPRSVHVGPFLQVLVARTHKPTEVQTPKRRTSVQFAVADCAADEQESARSSNVRLPIGIGALCALQLIARQTAHEMQLERAPDKSSKAQRQLRLVHEMTAADRDSRIGLLHRCCSAFKAKHVRLWRVDWPSRTLKSVTPNDEFSETVPLRIENRQPKPLSANSQASAFSGPGMAALTGKAVCGSRSPLAKDGSTLVWDCSHALLCVPLKERAEAAVSGVIEIVGSVSSTGGFDADDLRSAELLARLLSNEASSAADGTKLDTSPRSELTDLEGISSFDMDRILTFLSEVSSEHDIVPLMDKVSQRIRALLSAERCSLFLIDHVKKELVARFADVKQEVRIPISVGIAGQVATTGETLNIPDAYSHPKFNPAVDRKTGFQTRNILCVPVRGKDELVGVMQLVNKVGGAFDKNDETIMSALASRAGILLENAGRYDLAMRMEQKSQTMLTFIREIADQTDINHIIRIVKVRTQELLEVERCSVFLVDSLNGELYANFSDFGKEIRFPMNVGIAGHVASTLEVLNIPNAYEDSRFNPDIDRMTGFVTRSILCVPILCEDETSAIGVMQLVNKLDGTYFDKDDLMWLDQIRRDILVAKLVGIEVKVRKRMLRRRSKRLRYEQTVAEPEVEKPNSESAAPRLGIVKGRKDDVVVEWSASASDGDASDSRRGSEASEASVDDGRDYATKERNIQPRNLLISSMKNVAVRTAKEAERSSQAADADSSEGSLNGANSFSSAEALDEAAADTARTVCRICDQTVAMEHFEVHSNLCAKVTQSTFNMAENDNRLMKVMRALTSKMEESMSIVLHRAFQQFSQRCDVFRSYKQLLNKILECPNNAEGLQRCQLIEAQLSAMPPDSENMLALVSACGISL